MHTHTTHTCTHAQLDKLYVIKFGEVQLYKGNVLGQAGTLTHTCTHTHARTHARTQLDRDDVLVQARTHTHTHTHTQHTCTHTQLDKLYVIKFGEVQLYKDDVLVQAGDSGFVQEAGGFTFFGAEALQAPVKSRYTVKVILCLCRCCFCRHSRWH